MGVAGYGGKEVAYVTRTEPERPELGSGDGGFAGSQVKRQDGTHGRERRAGRNQSGARDAGDRVGSEPTAGPGDREAPRGPAGHQPAVHQQHEAQGPRKYATGGREDAKAL